MTKVEEIEVVVQSLSREEFRVLFDWMSKKDNEDWDRQFESDVKAGKLDEFAKEALADYNAGKCKLI